MMDGFNHFSGITLVLLGVLCMLTLALCGGVLYCIITNNPTVPIMPLLILWIITLGGIGISRMDID